MSKIIYKSDAEKKKDRSLGRDVEPAIVCLVEAKPDGKTIANKVAGMDGLESVLPGAIEYDGAVLPLGRMMGAGLQGVSSLLHSPVLAVISRTKDDEHCLPAAGASLVDAWAARAFKSNPELQTIWASSEVDTTFQQLLSVLNDSESQMDSVSGGSTGASCAPFSSLVLSEDLQEPEGWQQSLWREVGSVRAVEALGRNGPLEQRQRHMTQSSLLIAKRVVKFAQSDAKLTECVVKQLEKEACDNVNFLVTGLWKELKPWAGLAMALERSGSDTSLWSVSASQEDIFGVDYHDGIDLESAGKSRETRTAPTYYFFHDLIRFEDEAEVRKIAQEMHRRGLIGVFDAKACNAVLLNAMREEDDPVWDHLVAVEGRVIVSPTRHLGDSELAELTMPASYALQAAVSRKAFDTSIPSHSITCTPRHPKGDRVNGLIVKDGMAGEGPLQNAALLDVINGHVHITDVPTMRIGGRRARKVVADLLIRRLLRHFVVEVASSDVLGDLPALQRLAQEYLRLYCKGKKPWFKNVTVEGVRDVEEDGLVFKFDVVVSLRDEPQRMEVTIDVEST